MSLDMNEWREEMIQDDYNDHRYEMDMRDYDHDIFQDTVDTLMETACFLEYKFLLQELCTNYDRDFDGWWEYSLDSM